MTLHVLNQTNRIRVITKATSNGQAYTVSILKLTFMYLLKGYTLLPTPPPPQTHTHTHTAEPANFFFFIFMNRNLLI